MTKPEFSVGAGDYFYVIHNAAYNNALTQCDAQGSGIGDNINHDILGYVPTADDQVYYAGFGFPTRELGDEACPMSKSSNGSHAHRFVAIIPSS